MSVLVDTDVPVGAGLSSSAALTCSVALGAQRPRRPRADPDRPRRARPPVGERLRRGADRHPRPVGLAAVRGRARAVPRHPDRGHRAGAPGPGRRRARAARRGHRHLAHPRGRRLRRPAPRVRGGRRASRRAGTARHHRRPAELAALDDEVLRRRARHIVTENARVLEVVGILRGQADPRSIGPVLSAGHASLRDDFEISTPELDACVGRRPRGGRARCPHGRGWLRRQRRRPGRPRPGRHDRRGRSASIRPGGVRRAADVRRRALGGARRLA